MYLTLFVEVWIWTYLSAWQFSVNGTLLWQEYMYVHTSKTHSEHIKNTFIFKTQYNTHCRADVTPGVVFVNSTHFLRNAFDNKNCLELCSPSSTPYCRIFDNNRARFGQYLAYSSDLKFIYQGVLLLPCFHTHTQITYPYSNHTKLIHTHIYACTRIYINTRIHAYAYTHKTYTDTQICVHTHTSLWMHTAL